jgi:tetratricopeptide (TPR) repeat protein
VIAGLAKTHQLYKSDLLDAIYRRGSSPWTLVLFESAAFLGEAGGHARRAFLDAADITAVIISSRQRTWYPAIYMAECLEAICHILKGAPVVTLGSSMGGYAAIKYARRLGAVHAVGLAPQYSVDPALLLPGDPFAGDFRPELHVGMEITEQDVDCPVDIVVDPADPFDREHGRLISHAVKGCRTTNVRFAGHALEVLFAGPSALAELVSAFVENDTPAVRRLVRQSKRRSVYFHERLYQTICNQRPAAARWALAMALSVPPIGTDNRVSRFQVQMKLGRPEVAAAELQVAFERATRPAARQAFAHALAAAMAALGERDQAVSWMKTALDYTPDDDNFLIGYALRLIYAGRHAEAEPILTDLLRRSGHPSVFYAMSLVLKSQRNVSGAIEAARRSLVGQPANAAVRGYLAELLSQDGQEAEAGALHIAAIATASDGSTWFEWSRFLRARGRLDAALEAAHQAVRLAPSDPALRHHLSALLMDSGQPEEALRMCQQSIDLGISGGTGWMQMGTVLEKLGRPQEAVAAMKRATIEEPALAEHWAGLIDLLLRLDDVPEALKAAEHAYDSPCTRTPALLLAHSRLCLRLSDTEEAIEDARRAAAMAPENPGVRGILATYLLQANQPEAAAEQARQALLLAPDALWLQRILFTSLERCGRGAEALGAVQEAVAASPSDAELRGLLASQLLAHGDVPAACRAVAAALEAGLETASLWEVDAKLRAQAGDVQGAVAAMRRAVVLSPAHPGYFGALANYLLRLGDPAAAEGAARMALRLAPGVAWLETALSMALQQSKK